MTFPHIDPTQAPGPRTGPGCGGCGYMGYGPAMMPRCRHPERPCWCGPADWHARGVEGLWAAWHVGCNLRHDRGQIPLRPLAVGLAEHCCAVAEARRGQARVEAARHA